MTTQTTTKTTQLTPQAIFDTVSVHLLTQGKQARKPGSFSCLYRGPENTKCAVGCLIPDDLYQEEMEEAGDYTGLMEEHGEDLSPFFGDNADLLIGLQRIHDYNCATLWGNGLRDLAKAHSLSTATMDAYIATKATKATQEAL